MAGPRDGGRNSSERHSSETLWKGSGTYIFALILIRVRVRVVGGDGRRISTRRRVARRLTRRRRRLLRLVELDRLVLLLLLPNRRQTVLLLLQPSRQLLVGEALEAALVLELLPFLAALVMPLLILLQTKCH